ncbi:unnamed protein product, partial [Trichogramma brassicae]
MKKLTTISQNFCPGMATSKAIASAMTTLLANSSRRALRREGETSTIPPRSNRAGKHRQTHARDRKVLSPSLYLTLYGYVAPRICLIHVLCSLSPDRSRWSPATCASRTKPNLSMCAIKSGFRGPTDVGMIGSTAISHLFSCEAVDRELTEILSRQPLMPENGKLAVLRHIRPESQHVAMKEALKRGDYSDRTTMDALRFNHHPIWPDDDSPIWLKMLQNSFNHKSSYLNFRECRSDLLYTQTIKLVRVHPSLHQLNSRDLQPSSSQAAVATISSTAATTSQVAATDGQAAAKEQPSSSLAAATRSRPTQTATVTINSNNKSKQKSSWTLAQIFLSPPIVSAQEGQSNTAPIQRQKRGVVLLSRGDHLVSGVLQQLCVVRAMPRDEDVVKSRQLAIERVKSFVHRLASGPGSIYTNSSCESLRTWPYLPLPVPFPLPWQRKIAQRDVNEEPEPVAILAIAPLPLQPTTSPNLAHLTVTPPLSSDERTCQRQHQLTKVTVPPVRPPQWGVTIAKKAAQNALSRPANTLDEYIAAHPQNLLPPKPAISLCLAQRAPKPWAEPRTSRNPRYSPSRRPSARREAKLRRCFKRALGVKIFLFVFWALFVRSVTGSTRARVRRERVCVCFGGRTSEPIIIIAKGGRRDIRAQYFRMLQEEQQARGPAIPLQDLVVVSPVVCIVFSPLSLALDVLLRESSDDQSSGRLGHEHTLRKPLRARTDPLSQGTHVTRTGA